MTQTPTFVCAVPWQPERTLNAVKLARGLGATPVWDEKQSIFDTWSRMLATAGDGPAIFLEDDAQPVVGWREKIEAAIAEHPDDVIQFFTKHDRKTPGWREPLTWSFNLCYYLPSGTIPSILDYASTWRSRVPAKRAWWDAVDDLLGWWMESVGRRYWTVLPSLVQHAMFESVVDPHRRPETRRSDYLDGELDAL